MASKRAESASGRIRIPAELESMRFRDRAEAGRVLADAVREYAGRPDLLVLALPRGGVPVGLEVARALKAPLDVFLVRKLGVPGREELAMGALASGGVRLINDEVVHALHIPARVIDEVTQEEERELRRREREYRGSRPFPPIEGRTLILVDDGLATGSTMRAALASLRRQWPSAIVVAVPVASPATCEELRPDADDLVCPRQLEPFYAVGLWYEDFAQISDEDVRTMLDQAAQESAARDN